MFMYFLALMARYIFYQSAILLGSSIIGFLIFYITRRKMKKRKIDSVIHEDKPPAKWRRVGEISNLMMYPVKSGKAIHLQKAGCASLGLYDVDNPHIQLRDR